MEKDYSDVLSMNRLTTQAVVRVVAEVQSGSSHLMIPTIFKIAPEYFAWNYAHSEPNMMQDLAFIMKIIEIVVDEMFDDALFFEEFYIRKLPFRLDDSTVYIPEIEQPIGRNKEGRLFSTLDIRLQNGSDVQEVLTLLEKVSMDLDPEFTYEKVDVMTLGIIKEISEVLDNTYPTEFGAAIFESVPQYLSWKYGAYGPEVMQKINQVMKLLSKFVSTLELDMAIFEEFLEEETGEEFFTGWEYVSGITGPKKFGERSREDALAIFDMPSRNILQLLDTLKINRE